MTGVDDAKSTGLHSVVSASTALQGTKITHILLPNGKVLAEVAPDVFVDMDLFCWWPRRPEWNFGEIRVDLGTGD